MQEQVVKWTTASAEFLITSCFAARQKSTVYQLPSTARNGTLGQQDFNWQEFCLPATQMPSLRWELQTEQLLKQDYFLITQKREKKKNHTIFCTPRYQSAISNFFFKADTLLTAIYVSLSVEFFFLLSKQLSAVMWLPSSNLLPKRWLNLGYVGRWSM